MYSYRIVYGGAVTVEAISPEDAYRKFWVIIQERINEGQLGLIVSSTDPDVREEIVS